MNICSICLDSIENKIIILECNHTFHLECITKCIMNDITNCPYCRKDICSVLLSKILKKNKYLDKEKLYINLLLRDSSKLKYLDTFCRDNISLIEAAYKHDKNSLQYASNRIQYLKCKQNWYNIKYCSLNIKNDRNFIKKLIEIDWQTIRLVSNLYSKDEEIMLLTITKCGLAIKYADESIKKNINYAALALMHNGYIIKYLNESIQHHPKLVNIARYESKIKNNDAYAIY